jgi:hypothetical protein
MLASEEPGPNLRPEGRRTGYLCHANRDVFGLRGLERLGAEHRIVKHIPDIDGNLRPRANRRPLPTRGQDKIADCSCDTVPRPRHWPREFGKPVLRPPRRSHDRAEQSPSQWKLPGQIIRFVVYGTDQEVHAATLFRRLSDGVTCRFTRR